MATTNAMLFLAGFAGALSALLVAPDFVRPRNGFQEVLFLLVAGFVATFIGQSSSMVGAFVAGATLDLIVHSIRGAKCNRSRRTATRSNPQKSDDDE